MGYGRGHDMETHTVAWIIQVILLIILALVLLTPSDEDIKDYFDKQDKENDK
jgi:hypothetical protein